MPETTTAPTPHDPGQAMSGFIQELAKAGMQDAAANALAQPKDDNGQTPSPPAQPVVAPEPAKSGTTAPAVAASAPPKPDEAEPEDEKWPRNAENWKDYKAKRKQVEAQLKAERDAIKTERDTYQKQIDQLTKAGPSAELEALKKERDQFEQLVRVAAVESHPQFKKYFEGKTNEQLELAKEIVGNDQAESIVSLLKQPDSGWKRQKIEEAIAELSPFQQSQLAAVVNNLSAIQREKQAAVAQSNETYAKMQKDAAENTTKQAAQNKATLETAFKNAVARMQDPKTGLTIYQPKDGDEAWNKEIETRIATANNLLFGSATPDSAMETLLQGVGFPALLKSYQASLDENTKLQAQIKELQGAQPSLGTGTTPPAQTGEGVATPVTIKVGSNPHDVVSEWTKKITTDLRG